jgi:hypothetical protein
MFAPLSFTARFSGRPNTVAASRQSAAFFQLEHRRRSDETPLQGLENPHKL